MKNLTIRPGDKSAEWKSSGNGHYPDLDAVILNVHNDNLDEFLAEHSITLTPELRELATRDKTDTLALFGQEGLDFVLLSPPDDADMKLVFEANQRTLPDRTFHSLIFNLYIM
jgi:hypothetical protein